MVSAQILLWNNVVGSQVVTLTAPGQVLAAQLISLLSSLYLVPPSHIQLARHHGLWHHGTMLVHAEILAPTQEIGSGQTIDWRVFHG